jgi:hypothetical protein
MEPILEQEGLFSYLCFAEKVQMLIPGKEMFIAASATETFGPCRRRH